MLYSLGLSSQSCSEKLNYMFSLRSLTGEVQKNVEGGVGTAQWIFCLLCLHSPCKAVSPSKCPTEAPQRREVPQRAGDLFYT